MAAGLGFKTFTTGEVLTAADTNGYLMQGVLVFATATARNAAITSPQEGQFAFTKDTNGLWYYDGAAWVASGATGDIEGVTAGTGISGGGTSGTVTVSIDTAVTVDKTTAQTLTNKTLTSPALTTPTISTLTTNGDLIYGTGSGALSRLGIGSSAQVLTVAGGVPSWATAAGGGGMTLLSTTTLNAVTTTISSIDQNYTNLFILLTNIGVSDGDSVYLRPNSDSGSNYTIAGFQQYNSALALQQTQTGTRIPCIYSSEPTNYRQGQASVIIYNYTAATDHYIISNALGGMGGGNVGVGMINTLHRGSSAITSLYINGNAGTVTGTCKIYGVK